MAANQACFYYIRYVLQLLSVCLLCSENLALIRKLTFLLMFFNASRKLMQNH